MCLHASLLVGENDAGASLDGGVGEPDAVLFQAGDRNENPTGFAIVGRHCHACHRQVTALKRCGGPVRTVEALDIEAVEGALKRERVNGRANISH